MKSYASSHENVREIIPWEGVSKPLTGGVHTPGQHSCCNDGPIVPLFCPPCSHPIKLGGGNKYNRCVKPMCLSHRVLLCRQQQEAVKWNYTGIYLSFYIVVHFPFFLVPLSSLTFVALHCSHFQTPSTLRYTQSGYLTSALLTVSRTIIRPPVSLSVNSAVQEIMVLKGIWAPESFSWGEEKRKQKRSLALIRKQRVH